MEQATRIGFFDSGIGGFTILSSVRKELPQYDYLYYGDTANLPYGDKTEIEVHQFTELGVRRLFEMGARLVIVACNTASAEALRKIQDALIPHVYKDRRLLGVIIPTVETIISVGAHRVLLIGTARTVQSKKYDTELASCKLPECIFTSIATPELVPLLERGAYTDAVDYVKKTIGSKIGEIDTLVLGCTHYVLLKNQLREKYPRLTIISQDEIIPKKIIEYLKHHTEIETKLTRTGTLNIVLTKDSPEYRTKLIDTVA